MLKDGIIVPKKILKDILVVITIRGIATKKEDVCLKALDFYSFGHIIMGIVLFIISVFISCVFTNDLGIIILVGVITCFAGGIIWEIFENIVLLKTRIKFNERRDTWANSMTDQLLVVLGCITQVFIFNTANIFIISVFDTILITILFWLFYKTKKMTLKKCK